MRTPVLRADRGIAEGMGGACARMEPQSGQMLESGWVAKVLSPKFGFAGLGHFYILPKDWGAGSLAVFTFISVYVKGEGTRTMTCLWRTEDNFKELVLSSHHVGSRDQTQAVRLGSKHLYHPVTHALAPNSGFLRPMSCCVFYSHYHMGHRI